MSSDLNHLTQVGNDITAIKYYVWATGTVLFYDYLLTLTDEIKYVWSEKKSFAFWLFIVNRYFPMTYQLWQFGVSYSPQSKLDAEVCDKTAFYPAFSFVTCTLLAQVVLTLRMHAITMKNIPITIGFSLITLGQFSLGVYSLVFIVKGGAQQLPQIPLDAYHLCVFIQHRKLELIHSSISLLYDFLAFSLTIYFIARSKKAGFKLTIVLQTIAEDATQYFLFIFTSHLVLVLALVFGRESVQFLTTSASGNVIYLPVMISRLLLSLRKAVALQRGEQSPPAPSRGTRSFHAMRFVRPQRDTDSEGSDIQLHTYRSEQEMIY